ncbi:hypothetical protein Hanom_Chr16g01473211 [Helianthus anomalus]
MKVTQVAMSKTMGVSVTISDVTTTAGNPVLLGHYCLIMELLFIIQLNVVMVFSYLGVLWF